MARKVQIYVNGISNMPGNPRDWNARAVTWAHVNCPDLRGEKVEYFCGPIGRAFGQDGRAERLETVVRSYAGWDISLVGHSNGAAVALLALQRMNWPEISSLHLISGACEADFDKNGLNKALVKGNARRLVVYDAGKDNALQAANTWLGRMLGYGVLGLHGPINVSRLVTPAMLQTVSEPDYGHSTWFDQGNFDKTMGRLTAP